MTFWAVYFALSLWPSKPQVMSRRIAGLAALAAGVAAMFLLSRMQPAIAEPQPFFGRIGADLERIQRLRAPYNWVSTWAAEWRPQYAFLWLAAMAAYMRVRKNAPQDLKFFLVGLPLTGILAVPASYVLLERMKWVAAPQLQPARALVFVTVVAALLAAAVGLIAAARGRWGEAVPWLALAYAIPMGARLTSVVESPARLALAAGLAGLAALAAWSEAKRFRWSYAPWAAAIMLPFLLIPAWGGAPAQANGLEPGISELAGWARASTPEDVVFLFADVRKGVAPGEFRARALRAIYVDWKGGGQVNFLPHFASEWWLRWKRTGEGRFKAWHLPAYRRWGIDYIVLSPEHRLPGRTPEFENSAYLVYRTD